MTAPVSHHSLSPICHEPSHLQHLAELSPGSMSHLAGISLLLLLPCSTCAGSRGRSRTPHPHPMLSVELCREKEVPGRCALPVRREGWQGRVSLTGSLESQETSEGNALVSLCCAAVEIAEGSATRSVCGDQTLFPSSLARQSGWDFEEKSDIDAPVSHIYPRFLSDVFPPVAFPSNLNGFL